MKSKIVICAILFFNTYLFSIYSQTTSYGSGAVTTGDYSTYIGYNVGQPFFENSEGNTLIGHNSGILGTTSTSVRGENVFIGYNSGSTMEYNHYGIWHNVLIGAYAGMNSRIGMYNSSIGYKNGYASNIGSYNTNLGGYSAYSSSIGYGNSLFGYNSGAYSSLTSYNLMIGCNSGYHSDGGSYNSFQGVNSGAYSVVGNYNSFQGYSSGKHAKGYNSGTLERSIFSGYNSGYSAKTTKSIFIGESAGQSSNGENNLFLGNGAGSGLAGSNKLIIDNDVDGSGVPLVEGDFSSKFFTINGSIGVNTPTPGAALDVVGTIKAQEIQVTLASMEDLQLNGTLAANKITYTANGNTADHVFEENYNLKSLAEIESFIIENKHLPDVPSANEMEEKGVNLAEMNKLLLQKVEELTLYIIQQEKKFKEVNALKERLEKIETLINK